MQKSFKVALLVVGVIYFLFLVLARVPATWVAYFVHQSVPNLWLTGVTGTAWNGLARGAQIDIQNEPVPMGTFRWQVSPWSLLLLSPCIKFESQFANQPFDGEVCQSITGAVRISNLSMDAPLVYFEELLPMKASGQASLQIASASFSNINFQNMRVNNFDGRLSVLNTRISPENKTWMTLGSYAAVMKEGEDGSLAAQVLDLDAPFGVDLIVSYKFGDETFNANGTIEVNETAPQQAVDAIQIVGEEREDDVYFIQWP